MSKDVRVALIGCGRIVKNHSGALSALEGASLAAVCDIRQDRVRQVSGRCGVRAYTNYHEMLRTEDIDVVSLLTPSGMHPIHAVDLMERYGKHIVVEKPMALNAADLDRMKAVADRCGVTIFPIYQNRYNRAVQHVKQAIASGQLGRLVLGAVRVRWCRGQAYYDRDPWRGTWSLDGGALTNQGIHYLDLLLHLCGDVAAVSARTATQLVNVEVEDTGVATARFASGALGVVEVTTAARPDDFEAELSILGERGTAVLGGIACNHLRVFTPEPSACSAVSEEFPDAYGFGHWPFYRDVVAQLRIGQIHPLSFDEGARAIRFLNAIYRSAEDGTEVHLADRLSSARLGRPNPTLQVLYETQPEVEV